MNSSHAFFFAEASLAFVSGFRTHLSKSSILDRVIFVQYKMVVLTIVARNNGETIFLDQAIPQVHFMKLISCSLYNSWDTLEKEGALSIIEDGKEKLSKVPPGHYTLEAVAETIKGFSDKIRVDVYSPLGPLIITELTKQPLLIDRDLRSLFDNNLRHLRKKWLISSTVI